MVEVELNLGYEKYLEKIIMVFTHCKFTMITMKPPKKMMIKQYTANFEV